MSAINSLDYTNRQVGWGQGADINTNIHDCLLTRAAMTQDAGKFQTMPSTKTPKRGITRMLRGVFTSLLLS
jgi:hypothetical protein